MTRAKAARLLVGLLVVAGTALEGGEPAWRFSLAAGRSIPSSVTAVNRCRETHSFRVSASPAPGFVTFHGPVDVQVAPKGNATVQVEFSAAGLGPGLHRGEIVIKCLDCGAEPGCTQDTQHLEAEMTVLGGPDEGKLPQPKVAPLEPLPGEAKTQAVPATPLEWQEDSQPTEQPHLVGLTLELFWKLAFVDTKQPETLPELLELEPDEAAARLWRLETNRAQTTVPRARADFAEQVGEVGRVTPRFVFAREFTDLVPRANSRGLRLEAGTPGAPPMMFHGRRVSLLVIFEPRTRASGGPPSRGAIPAVFSPGVWPTLRRASAAEELRYDAEPQTWSRASPFIEHTLCGDLSRMMRAVTSLTYEGGQTATKTWKPPGTGLSPVATSTCMRVKQMTLPVPPPPVIVASGALMYREGGTTPLIAADVVVPK